MNKKRKISLFDIVNTTVMLILLVIVLFPLYYTIIASVSNPDVVATGEVLWKPVGFTLDAYNQVFSYKPIWRGYANTIFYTIAGTTFSMCLTIPAAYALSKKNMPFRNILTTFFLITMYFSGGMVPSYILVKNLGLLDTRTVMVITGAAGISIYNLIVARVFFSSSIPEALYEAAELDGAGEFRKFFSIALPLSKAILAVLVLYYAVGIWNDYFSALLYISDPGLEPLQMVLRKVLIQNQNALNEILLQRTLSAEEILDSAKRARAAYTMKYALVFVGSAPLLCAYPFVQKYFIKGVMIGAVKE